MDWLLQALYIDDFICASRTCGRKPNPNMRIKKSFPEEDVYGGDRRSVGISQRKEKFKDWIES